MCGSDSTQMGQPGYNKRSPRRQGSIDRDLSFGRAVNPGMVKLKRGGSRYQHSPGLEACAPLTARIPEWAREKARHWLSLAWRFTGVATAPL